MNITLTLTIAFAVLMLLVAAVSIKNYSQISDELNATKAQLKEAMADNDRMAEKISCTATNGGIGESSVLAIISEITRIENNLYHMAEVPGRKQITKAIDRMKATLQAEDYTIVPMLGSLYWEGMQVSAVFVQDDSCQPGTSVIISVKKPQVNRAGKMIQAASVTVGQNL